MNDAQIFTKLQSILETHTSIKAEVTTGTALLGSNLIDSMDFMNYITAVEESFGITITDDEISELKLGIVGNMVSFIGRKTS